MSATHSISSRILSANNLFNQIWAREDVLYVPWSRVLDGENGFMETALQHDFGGVCGETSKALSEDRKILIQKTPWGNILLFETSLGVESKDIIGSAPDAVQSILPIRGRVSRDMLAHIFSPDPNKAWGGRILKVLWESQVAFTGDGTPVNERPKGEVNG